MSGMDVFAQFKATTSRSCRVECFCSVHGKHTLVSCVTQQTRNSENDKKEKVSASYTSEIREARSALYYHYCRIGIYRVTKISRKADLSVFRVYFISRVSVFYSAIY